MNATERHFLDAVIAAPDDDTPRLVMADWLEEQGDEARAEFIRVQCELATYGNYYCNKRVPKSLYGLPIVVDGWRCACKWCRLKDREEELLHATTPDEWSDFPACLCENKKAFWQFRRGFVEEIRLSAEDWICHADELVRLAPIREVSLTTAPKIGRNYDPINRRASFWFFHGQGDKTKTVVKSYFGVDDYQSSVFGGDIDEWGRRELLKENWPNIKFTLPHPPSSMSRWSSNPYGYLLESTPNEGLVVNDLVGVGPEGRAVRVTNRDEAIGVALSEADEQNVVRVQLFPHTLPIMQNVANEVAEEMGVPAPQVRLGPVDSVEPEGTPEIVEEITRLIRGDEEKVDE